MRKIITQSERWVLMISILVIFYLPYLAVNHISAMHTTLPFIFGEENIPFLPWTILIYLSVFMQGTFLFSKVHRSIFPSIFSILGIIVSLHIMFFISFPTAYPRECYSEQNILMDMFRTLDTPANCLPSLHVAVALLFGTCYQLGVKGASRASVILVWLWSLAIIISTLTTKQHYLLDIFGAIVLDGGIIFFFRKTLQPRE